MWQTTASSVLLPFCRQRKLASPPVLLHSPLIIWFYGVPSASWLSSVIFSSTASHTNQTTTKSPNHDLSSCCAFSTLAQKSAARWCSCWGLRLAVSCSGRQKTSVHCSLVCSALCLHYYCKQIYGLTCHQKTSDENGTWDYLGCCYDNHVPFRVN